MRQDADPDIDALLGSEPPVEPDLDAHMGQRIKMIRLARGLSQAQLARDIGVTYQQVQKYERGSDRISATRLYRIAAVLRTPVAVFFDGLAGPEGAVDPQHTPDVLDDMHRLLADPNGRELAQNFPRLDARARAQVGALIRAVTAADGRIESDAGLSPI